MISKLQEWLQTLPLLPPDEFSAIHIDVLSAEFKDFSNWITGVLTCLDNASIYASIHSSEGILCAAFSLVGDNHYIGVNYHSSEELSKQFGLTPPSLYYFGMAAVPWLDSTLPFKRVEISNLNINKHKWMFLHLEYLHANEAEYRRSLWVVPSSAINEWIGIGANK
jgi:hypothetical protein